MQQLTAFYFDGQTSKRTAVQLTASAQGVLVQAEGLHKAVPLDQIIWPEPRRHGARLLRFSDGSYCEFPDGTAFEAWRATHGLSPRFVVAASINHWRGVMLATLLLVALLFAGYRWGLPALSEWLAYRLPTDLLQTTEQDTLKFLDGGWLKPSQLSPARQQALRQAFAQLQLPPNSTHASSTALKYQLEFRASDRLGANAFALPAGTIVVTDALVQLAANDDQILAVLTHELGHLERRHALRSLIQSTVVGTAAAWFLGDVSSILSTFPALLLELRYSREFEYEADTFAVRMLRANQKSPELLAEMLQQLEQSHQSRDQRPTVQSGQSDDHTTRKKQSDLFDYFSTHPDTDARIIRLRAQKNER